MDQILSVLLSIYEFITSILLALVEAYTVLQSSIVLVFNLAGFLPSFFGTAILLTFAIFIIRFLAGK